MSDNDRDIHTSYGVEREIYQVRVSRSRNDADNVTHTNRAKGWYTAKQPAVSHAKALADEMDGDFGIDDDRRGREEMMAHSLGGEEDILIVVMRCGVDTEFRGLVTMGWNDEPDDWTPDD